MKARRKLKRITKGVQKGKSYTLHDKGNAPVAIVLPWPLYKRITDVLRRIDAENQQVKAKAMTLREKLQARADADRESAQTAAPATAEDEAWLMRTYGKTSNELADEADQGYPDIRAKAAAIRRLTAPLPKRETAPNKTQECMRCNQCGQMVPVEEAYRATIKPFHWNVEGGGHTMEKTDEYSFDIDINPADLEPARQGTVNLDEEEEEIDDDLDHLPPAKAQW